ncbi:hypothetical protein FKP32DRAFT_1139151 [Trametes sanguinea]|nr:hypothetical protein FKP32DRAFT_1139151 [Trametes sanguinea]
MQYVQRARAQGRNTITAVPYPRDYIRHVSSFRQRERFNLSLLLSHQFSFRAVRSAQTIFVFLGRLRPQGSSAARTVVHAVVRGTSQPRYRMVAISVDGQRPSIMSRALWLVCP